MSELDKPPGVWAEYAMPPEPEVTAEEVERRKKQLQETFDTVRLAAEITTLRAALAARDRRVEALRVALEEVHFMSPLCDCTKGKAVQGKATLCARCVIDAALSAAQEAK